MKKRIISALLAVCLLVSLGTVGVFADGSETEPAAGDVHDTLPVAKEGVITLDKDVVLSTSADISESVVLDLNGHSITASDSWTSDGIHDYLIGVKRGATLTIRDSGNNGIINAAEPSKEGLVVAVKLTTKGESETGNTAALIVNGGTIKGTDYAISGNGTRHGTSVTINGGDIIATNGTGIYNPQEGTLTVKGGSISGVNSAIELRSGTLNITGGSFTATAPSYSEAASGSGTTVTGAAVAISQHTTKKPITVSISGGTFTGAYAFSETNVQNGSATKNVKITGISNGTFIGNVASDNCTGFITGGTFKVTDDTELADCLAPGLDVDDSGKVVVGSNAVAQVGDKYFENLQDAITAAQDGPDKTVEILKDFDVDLTNGTNKNGIYTITGNITIDGNNRTIKATGAPTGDVHVFVVSGSANAKIIDLNINGNGIAHYGIQASGSSAKLELDDVEAYACEAYGVFSNNGATVNAANLRTHGNEWGGVNVDHGSTFTMKSGRLADKFSVVVDGGTTTKDNVVNLTGGTYNNIQIKTEKSDVNISGGTYNDIVGGNATDTNRYILNGTEADVTGGTFEENVNRFARVDYVVVGSDYSYFGTLNNALAAAGVGDSIEYLGGAYYTVEFVYEKGVSDTYEVPRNNYIELPGGKYDGKVITGWTRGSVTYDVGDDVRVDRNMTFYVVLKDGEFDIVIDSKIDHGDISTNVNSADKGDTVYIYVDPDTGYVLDDIDVYYGLNYRYSVKVSYVRNNTYRFEMPNADVYITATFKANGMPFVDVHRTQWFYDSIYYVWSNDMMEGDSATTFNPDGTMTRAMFWAVLGRMDGQTITGTNWVEQARNWAMREGVSDGTNPNDYVTREQMVTMLWRYAGEKNGSANLNRYTDSGSVSGYAVEAMRWAIGNGVIQGVTSTTLAPKANATRAECATIFMRFDKM